MVATVPRPGPAGPSGPAGPAGPAGPSGDLTYLHPQLVPAAVWTINHGLGKEPSVTVITSANDEVVGDVAYPTINQVVITFAAALGGRARLN